MQDTREHGRTRPRVARACERCRIKKAKCDGQRPCRRCNLDSAVCSYMVRRKPESAGANQRYTNLLVQYHSALAAGLIKLYSKLLDGQLWNGAPVDEIDGSPSVHCILERIGVIGTEEEFDDNIDISGHSERPQVVAIKEADSTAGMKKQPKLATQKSATNRKSENRAPRLQIETRSGSRNFDKTHRTQAVQLASPSNSEIHSSVFESGGCDTPSSWNSPGFADVLFQPHVRTPGPNYDSQNQFARDIDMTMSQSAHPFPAQQPNASAGMTMNAQSPLSTPFGYGLDMLGADNFVEATCDVNFYDWEGNNSFGMGLEPGMFLQSNNAWNDGVFA